jgi:hypothetical protein
MLPALFFSFLNFLPRSIRCYSKAKASIEKVVFIGDDSKIHLLDVGDAPRAPNGLKFEDAGWERHIR